ncbi:hypothetical protein ABW21_db0208283 [Orbilia brochopaga]|nr:hypothetical protein ABW21_db0208283 [Drechslerella brochopaga]
MYRSLTSDSPRWDSSIRAEYLSGPSALLALLLALAVSTLALTVGTLSLSVGTLALTVTLSVAGLALTLASTLSLSVLALSLSVLALTVAILALTVALTVVVVVSSAIASVACTIAIVTSWGVRDRGRSRVRVRTVSVIETIVTIVTGSRGSAIATRGGTVTAANLNGDAAAERTVPRGVLAADHADVAGSAGGTRALLVCGDLDLQRQVLLGTLSVLAVVTSDVLRDRHLDKAGAGTGGVDHAGVGTCTVAVYLVESHAEDTAGSDLRHAVGDSLRHEAGDVELSRLDGLTASLGLSDGALVAEDGGVALEGVSVGTRARGGVVDSEGLARGAVGAGGLDDDAVGRDLRDHGHESQEGRDSDLGVHVVWWCNFYLFLDSKNERKRMNDKDR